MNRTKEKSHEVLVMEVVSFVVTFLPWIQLQIYEITEFFLWLPDTEGIYLNLFIILSTLLDYSLGHGNLALVCVVLGAICTHVFL